jgi:FkbM family methyltransferase
MDYRRSDVARRRSWYGLKKYVKGFAGLRIPHWFLRRIVAFAPAIRNTGRLPAPAYLAEVEGNVHDARFVMLRPSRCVVAKELYWGNGRRPGAADNFAIEMFATLARDSEVMFDIGAYTGIFTLVGTAVNPNLEAHAFEFVPEVFRALFDNCVRNDVLHRTTLYHVGVGRPDDLFRVPPQSSDSALPSFYSSKLTFETGTLVRFRSLDSLADVVEPGSRVVVKVDVEGTENEIFRHGQEFLAGFHPDVLCEVLAGVADAVELEGLLTAYGYRFFLVRGRDVLPRAGISPDPQFRDWLFTTRTADDLTSMGIPVGSERSVD